MSAYWPEDTPRYAHIPLRTLAEVTIYPAAEEDPGRIALVTGAGPLTYGELSEKVRRFADALRNRVERGARVAIVLDDAAAMVIAALGTFEAEGLAFVSTSVPPADAMAAFSPDLIVSDAEIKDAPAPVVRFGDLIEAQGKARSGRVDFRAPVLAIPARDRRGEVLHSHRSLTATAVSIASFYLLDAEIILVLLEPPTLWYTLALMLGALHKRATIWAAWEDRPPKAPLRADYVVCGWERAMRLLDEPRPAAMPGQIDAGLIAAVEGPFSVSLRLRLARKLATQVLTILGQNDFGPIIASHPGWYLADAAGIPLPNVDLRPLNPADGVPLTIGWEVVEQAELGVKSALAPAGAPAVQGWFRSGLMAAVDPTGFYFLRSPSRPRGV
ncbi:MAG TPA: AMP-binding protein [Acidimicrobiales bacterium]|nr:AMP-binding protein [Acidimicrobiales bacterium]